MPLVFKGGKSEQRAIHASLYALYFSHSTNNDLLFSREGRMNWKQSMRAFTFFTSHTQQTMISCFQGREERTEGIPCEPSRSLLLTLNKQQSPVSKGGKSEQRAIHASFHIIYFSFSTSNDLLFPREEKLLRGYWYGNMKGLADWSHIEQPCNLRQIAV